MKTDELLNATKNALGIESDYALAKALGVSKTRIGNYRTGTSRPNLEMCFQIAEILNIEPQAVITAVRLEGSSTPEERTFWARYAKKYGIAAAITPFMFASTIALTSLAVHQEAQAGNNDRVCIMRNNILPKHWKGWTFWEGFLVDPQGNRYTPEMVRASIFAQELAHELAGSPLQVHSLKQELRKRLNALQESPEVVIRWQGNELTVKLPKAQ